jgi:triacylglycerol lipase
MIFVKLLRFNEMEFSELSSIFTDFLSQNLFSSLAIILVASGFLGTGFFSYIRRVKPSQKPIGEFFVDHNMLFPPMARPAYSDRMAYVLAEMSDLAYFQFEGPSKFINDAVNSMVDLKLDDTQSMRKFLDAFSEEALLGHNISVDTLRKLLKNSGFDLIQTINIKFSQAFVCKRNIANEQPYLVIAFRGTEDKISDWLTDAYAVPTQVGATKIHTGFYNAFSVNTDENGSTIETILSDILKSNHALNENGCPLPLFLTGHSLGGALALLATRQLASDINGACYTFGAPRVASYEYFENIKTPVYRVTNSSDIVPKIPPGALNVLLVNSMKALIILTSFYHPLSRLFKKLELLIDTLNGYRHFGDLRYLTDVAEGRFQDVKLLSNPPAIDRIIWFWKHISASFKAPVNSHSMLIYRKKIYQVACDRNRKVIEKK